MAETNAPKEKKRKRVSSKKKESKKLKSEYDGEEWFSKTKYVKCIHCRFKEKRKNYEVTRENVASLDAIMCLDCCECVCEECIESLYTLDKRYDYYMESAGYIEFCCKNCLKEGVDLH